MVAKRTPFGKLLVEQLGLMGKTQAWLASELSVTPDTVNAWVVGKFPPALHRIPKIASLLEIPQEKLLTAYYASSYKSDQPKPLYRSADWNVVKSWGWDGVKLLRYLVPMDVELIGRSDFRSEWEGSPEQWGPIFERWPEFWRVITFGDTNEIVGYWHIAILNEDMYKKAIGGKLLDSEVDLNAWDDVGPNSYYKAYLVFMGLKPEHSGMEGRKIIYDSLVRCISKLSDRGIFFEQIYCCAVTPSGFNTCARNGMDYVCMHSTISQARIYKIDLIPFPCNNHRLGFYEGLFEKYKCLRS